LTNKKKYFACANTCIGFVNRFDSVIQSQNLEKIYIIKEDFNSKFINEAAEIAEEKKYSVEYFSSPFELSHLNGIIIKELKTAIISNELSNYMLDMPPVIEIIIDFSKFFDELKILDRKQEIFELVQKRNESLNSAYKFLRAANELSESIAGLSKKYINHEKLDSFIERLINKNIPVNEKSLHENTEFKFINTVSSSGELELDTLEAESKKIFCISNVNFLGWYCTKKIAGKFVNISKVICPDTLNPDNIRAIFLKNSKILFIVKDEIFNSKYDFINFINMERFISADFKKENKQKLKFIQKCYKSIMGEVAKYIAETDSINTSIEFIYNSSIDMSINKNEKDKYIAKFIKKIIE